MHPVVVGIADCQLSDDPDSVLVTYALGSCIAVVIYDPVVRVAGMLHLMLPDSTIEGLDAGRRPHMFADTGIPWLFRRAYAMGADKKRLQVRLAGGAQVMDDHGVFDIGKRNYTATRKILWKVGRHDPGRGSRRNHIPDRAVGDGNRHDVGARGRGDRAGIGHSIANSERNRLWGSDS